MENVNITRLLLKHAQQVAELHISGIGTGFISSLGINFVTALYEAIAESECGFGLVAERDNKVIGFAAFTTDLSALYRSVIFKNGLKFAFLLARKMFSLRTIKRVFETLFYPARIKKSNLPSADFLSMVISEEARGKGLATMLVKKGFAECAQRGIEKLKILAAIDIEPINKMYEKFGFDLVGRIDSHGIASNVYVVGTNHFEKK